MKKKRFIVLLFIMSLFFVGCGKMITKFAVTVHNKSYLYTKFSNGEKEIIHLPMIHLNNPEYYEMIKNKVDSLREIGYKVYYESVALNSNNQLDSIQRQTALKKFRKVVGFVPMDYFAEENKQSNQLKVKGYIMQSFINTGVDPTKDIKADIPMDSLVYLYEKEKGEILLNNCDIETKIGQKYKCSKIDKNDYNFIVGTLRDNHLVKTLSESKDNKILLLFGKAHENALKNNLKQADSSWTHKYIRP